MTQKDKELLLRDLCARLPYGVKLQNINNKDSIVKLYSIDFDNDCHEIKYYTYEGKALTICNASRLLSCGKFLRYKPYLFPLSSMTEEQSLELEIITDGTIGIDTYSIWDFTGYSEISLSKTLEIIQWCYQNHFDINGLIPMGLAIDATNLNIY